jgi:antitoxin VapB
VGWREPQGGADAASRGCVRLFRNGRNREVRIPREFELPGTAAVRRREGDRLIIESAKSRLALLATLEPLGEEFPAVPEPEFDPVEL